LVQRPGHVERGNEEEDAADQRQLDRIPDSVVEIVVLEQDAVVPQPRPMDGVAVPLPVGEPVVHRQDEGHEHHQHVEHELRRDERHDQAPPRPLEHLSSGAGSR
jgi:hypothetical protein